MTLMLTSLRNLLLAAAATALAACAGSPNTQQPAGPAQPAAANANEYRIGSGDQLNVFVFNQPDLSVTVPVRPDGLISTPLIENMQAAGKTPSELARDMEKTLAEYIRSPTVNIIVTNFVGTYGDQIRVVGQAANPQALAYRSGMTVLDVMIAVGGLGEFAAGNRARLVRRLPNGESQEMRVRLDDLLNDGDINANIVVQPGDVIIIPESRF
jgi:polysaccharide biosynthesis/export protein